MKPLDVPMCTGAFLAGGLAAWSARRWFPALERLDRWGQAWWEARRVDVLVRDRIAEPRVMRTAEPGRKPEVAPRVVPVEGPRWGPAGKRLTPAQRWAALNRVAGRLR